MNTKEKIMRAAISMFNERGFARVSLGEISDALAMSKGNLTYHYKNREELLKAIYEKMFQEMESFMGKKEVSPLELLTNIPRINQEFTYAYRFFFANLVSISQEFPWVATRHRKVVAIRLEAGEKVLHFLVQSGDLLPEPHPQTFASLSHLIWMTSTFWHVQHPILPEDHPAHHTGSLSSTLTSIITPYLTPQGLTKWQNLNPHQHENN